LNGPHNWGRLGLSQARVRMENLTGEKASKEENVGRGDRKLVRWKKDRRRKKKAREDRIARAKGARRR
jgi:hypothetical protein